MWRMRLDSSSACLALEVRDPDLLLTRFYTFNTHTHNLAQLPLPEAKAWWQGLEDAEFGNLYLHGYGNRQMGQHKGIMAYKSADQSKLWEAAEMAFYGTMSGGILAYNPDRPELPLQLINPQTGAPTGSTCSQQEAAEAVAQYSRERFQNCLYPVLYRQGEAYFAQVQAFLQEQLKVQAVLALEYAETEAHLVISFYTSDESGKLKNELAVFDLDGKLHQKMEIASQLNGFGSDTFFIFNHKLYFILNKDILQVFQLLA